MVLPYTMKTYTYVSQHNLPLSTVQPSFYELLKQHQMNCFIHVISKDNILIFTNGDFGHEKEKQDHQETRMQQQNAYIYAEHLYDIQIFMLIEK